MATHTPTRHPSRQRGQATGAKGRTRARSAGARAAAAQRRGRRGYLLWGLVLVAVAAVIGAMMYSARTTSSADTRTAPAFTLTNTDGKQVSLADYRGHTVVLYFNEGAGCQSCLYQMVDIEQHAADFTRADIVVLPIVMNTAADIRHDMTASGVRTPFLLDSDGSVSRAYGTLGKGMHAGLPGHSFVLVDKTGVQRWYGEYPSMYLSPADLLKQVNAHLT